MVMTLSNSKRPASLNNPSRRETHVDHSTDLLPWADPYILSLMQAHEQAVHSHQSEKPLARKPK